MAPVPSRRIVLGGLLASLTLPVASRADPFDRARVAGAPVTLKRGFVETPGGQIHYRHAAPLEAPPTPALPVVCFHQSPVSSETFIELMAVLGTDRDVYAFDTPGFGESDRPAAPPEIEDYADALLAALDGLGLLRVNLIGYHTGASIGLTLAARAPDRVGALLLAGLALVNAEERAAFFANPWPAPREPGGGHLQIEWNRSFAWRGPGQSDAGVERVLLEKLGAGETAWWGARAVMRHDLEAPLRAATAPLLIINARDDLYAITPRARTIRPDARFVSFEERGFGLMEAEANAIAALARAHFDGA